MVELYWPRETTFLGQSEQYSRGVHDVPDDQEEAFRERGWEDPPGEGGDEGNPGDDSAEEFEQSMDDVEAATDPDAAADDAGSDDYTRDELEEMAYGDLQTLAAEADTNEIDGRSSRDDIIEALSDE